MFGVKKYLMRKRQRIFILILSIKQNGDQMNARLLILHQIPISTPPSMECNCALVSLRQYLTKLENKILFLKPCIDNLHNSNSVFGFKICYFFRTVIPFQKDIFLPIFKKDKPWNQPIDALGLSLR